MCAALKKTFFGPISATTWDYASFNCLTNTNPRLPSIFDILPAWTGHRVILGPLTLNIGYASYIFALHRCN